MSQERYNKWFENFSTAYITCNQASEGRTTPDWGIVVGLVLAAFTLGGFLSSNAVVMPGATAALNTLSVDAFTSLGRGLECDSIFVSPPVAVMIEHRNETFFFF